MEDDKQRASVERKYKLKKAMQANSLEDFKAAYPLPKEKPYIKKANNGMVKALPEVLTKVSDTFAKQAKKGMKKSC